MERCIFPRFLDPQIFKGHRPCPYEYFEASFMNLPDFVTIPTGQWHNDTPHTANNVVRDSLSSPSRSSQVQCLALIGLIFFLDIDGNENAVDKLVAHMLI